MDRAKSILHLVGMNARGQVLLRKRMTRGAVLAFMAMWPPVTVGREACGGAPYWARRLREHGHTVTLMAPQYVKPSVKTNKNDLRDAEAIAKAVPCPRMPFVPIKTVAQQDIQAFHRVRERLSGARTALINAMRGLLAEYGLVLPGGVKAFRQAWTETLDPEQTKLPPLREERFRNLGKALEKLATDMAHYEDKLQGMATAPPEAQRLRTIPGIGPLTAPALLAAVSDVRMAERAHRLGVLWRKRSQGTCSDKGNRWVERVLLLRHTCRLRGRLTWPILVGAIACLCKGERPNLRWITQHASLPVPSTP